MRRRDSASKPSQLRNGAERPRKRTVGGFSPRPMAIEVVEDRLRKVKDPKKRWKLALHLAETCYECFAVENLFRELINCDPTDLDGILTALIDLQISFDHIGVGHLPKIKRPLAGAIRAIDTFLP